LNKSYSKWPIWFNSTREYLVSFVHLAQMPLDLLVFELLERTSPIHPNIGSHICLLSLFLGHLDEPVKLFPDGFIKMMFIHLKFCPMPTPGYLCSN